VDDVIMDDRQLLEEYALRNSDEAFRALAERHGGMVYHSALRQLRDPHKAEEITQAVFIALARKAGSLSRSTVLSGWLFRATRLAVLNHLRQENRRRHYEQEAAAMETHPNQQDDESIWKQISPHLDDALNRLTQVDREAVVIRFFENKSHKEVGALLGMSEETARRRVSRAVEKLRAGFASRGIIVTTVALAAAFGAHGAQAAPAGLASSLTAAAFAKASAGSASTLASAKGILKLMALANLKLAVVAGVSVLAAVGTTAVILQEAHAAAAHAKVGEPLEGMVTLPDGTPATNITVYLCLEREYLDLTPDGHLGPPTYIGGNGQLQVVMGYKLPDHTQTGPDGRFEFAAWTAPAWLLATDDRGFALIFASNLMKETPMMLKPMATITGTLFVGAKPAPNEIMRVLSVDTNTLDPDLFFVSEQIFDEKVMLWGTHIKTDTKGRFSFRVPAADYRLVHDLGLEVRMMSGGSSDGEALTQATPVHTEWGKTNTIKVGGEGRTVVGHLGGVGGSVAWTNEIYFAKRVISDPGPKPEGMSAADDLQRVQAWYHSPEGQAAIWAARRYLVETGPDGSFKIQDMEPGEYTLHFPLEKRFVFKARNAGTSMLAADASVRFTVGPVPSGHDPDADPLDLGYITRDWTTNFNGSINYWAEHDDETHGMLPADGPMAMVRGRGQRGGPASSAGASEEETALQQQLKSRQSAKSTVNETTIDLSHYVTAKLTEPLGEYMYLKNNTLADLPSGVHVFGGVPFNVSGLVELDSSLLCPLVRPLPDEKDDIAIGRKFKKLHILNGAVAAQNLAPEEVIMRKSRFEPEYPPQTGPIAKLVLHYVDGRQAELPIVPGEQLLEFVGPYLPWKLSDLPESTELAWSGTNPYLKEYVPQSALHLYRTTFDNPRPDMEVKSVDYVSTLTWSMPFIAGLTVE
jgi:RNA polymerase sigma factor (sigma-70 family)